MIKKLFMFSGIGLIVLIIIISLDFIHRSPVTTEEIIRNDEAEQARIAQQRFIEIVEKNKTDYVGRGAHAKGHACVKAYLDVVQDISPDLQYGIFSDPGKRYKTWIRFSNANSNFANHPDLDRDAHGMAIKVLNVTGVDQNANIQDFLMADNPAFFSPDIDVYNRFLASKNYISFFFPGINPLSWRFREFYIALRTLKTPPASPLRISYFSNTAYKLGENNIKFSSQPCTGEVEQGDQETTDADYLRKNMQATLEKNQACFDFKVQLQRPDKNMPIEDPSVTWREVDSPYITVAKLNLLQQWFDTEQQQTFCENLSFSPWNSLAEHRPIGQLNRIRKQVYQSSSEYRHRQNNVEVPSQIDW